MSVNFHFQHFTDGEPSLFPRQLLLDAIAPYLLAENDEFGCLEVDTIAESILCDSDEDIDGFMVTRPGGAELYAVLLPLMLSQNLVWIMEDGSLMHAMEDFERHVPEEMFEDFIIGKVGTVEEIERFLDESGSEVGARDSAFNS